MSPNRIDLRSNDQSDVSDSLAKRLVSGNVCSISQTIRNQTHPPTGRSAHNRTTVENLPLRFWSKVQRLSEDECWPWLGGTHKKTGCGQMRVPVASVGPNTRRYAPVIAWTLANSAPVPHGHVVRHSCDNPNCVNPKHLLIGTQRDNVHDSIRRGRRNSYGHQKLTLPDVSRIRSRVAAGEVYRGIAADFGIDESTISGIVNGHSWQSFPEPSQVRS